jgi:hypothetical protein
MCWIAQVFTIREAATTNLQKLAQEFGAEWAKEHLVQQVLNMINNPHYLYRMTILVAIAALAPVVSHDVLCSQMLPVVISCSKDQVRLPPFPRVPHRPYRIRRPGDPVSWRFPSPLYRVRRPGDPVSGVSPSSPLRGQASWRPSVLGISLLSFTGSGVRETQCLGYLPPLLYWVRHPGNPVL